MQAGQKPRFSATGLAVSTRFFRIPRMARLGPLGAAIIALPLARSARAARPRARLHACRAAGPHTGCPWWAHSGDPLLDTLVSEALAREPAPSCALPPPLCPPAWRARCTGWARPIAGRRHGRQQAARRLASAQDIALAYLRARGWQARFPSASPAPPC
jgi:hypothetical protein